MQIRAAGKQKIGVMLRQVEAIGLVREHSVGGGCSVEGAKDPDSHFSRGWFVFVCILVRGNYTI